MKTIIFEKEKEEKMQFPNLKNFITATLFVFICLVVDFPIEWNGIF